MGIEGGGVGSGNLFLHEMALGVCVLQSFRPHLAPWCSFSFHAVLPHWVLWGSPFSWGDCLSLLSGFHTGLEEQGSWYRDPAGLGCAFQHLPLPLSLCVFPISVLCVLWASESSMEGTGPSERH